MNGRTRRLLHDWPVRIIPEGLDMGTTVRENRIGRELCARGFPVGPSSGLNVAGARQLARRIGPGARVATVLCDRMERYFSTDLFADVPASSAAQGASSSSER